jgi:hypothetical protein
MANETIPVPAESIRRMTENAAQEVRRARADGRKHTADDLQRSISEALEAAEGNDGEFVSIKASTAASLAAFGQSRNVPDSRQHCDAVAHYLNQYGYW